jgi:hypothetical protein
MLAQSSFRMLRLIASLLPPPPPPPPRPPPRYLPLLFYVSSGISFAPRAGISKLFRTSHFGDSQVLKSSCCLFQASFRRISAASFRPLSGVLRLSGLFQASFRRHISFRRISAASFRPFSGLFQPLSGVLPLSGATFLFLRHNAQAASIWPRKTRPQTHYYYTCVLIPHTALHVSVFQAPTAADRPPHTAYYMSSCRILLCMCPYSRQAWPRRTDPQTSRQTLLLLLLRRRRRQLLLWRYRCTPKPQPLGAPLPPKLRLQVPPTASLRACVAYVL